MASNITPQYRGPRTDDGPTALLAKLLAAQAQRVTGTALASAVRNATTQSAFIDCTGFRAIIVYLRVVTNAGADTLRIVLRGLDPASGQLLNVAQSSAVTVTTVASFGLGASIPCGLPDQLRIEIQHSPSPSGNFEYTVGYCLVP